MSLSRGTEVTFRLGQRAHLRGFVIATVPAETDPVEHVEELLPANWREKWQLGAFKSDPRPEDSYLVVGHFNNKDGFPVIVWPKEVEIWHPE